MKRLLGAAVPMLVLGLGSACDEPHERPSERLPLATVDVPSLACSEPFAQLGDCQRSDDCGAGQHCRLDPVIEQVDRGPLTLSCGAPLGTLNAREPCSSGDECTSGLCGLSGICVEACASDDDCSTGQNCLRVEVRVADRGLAPVRACTRQTAFSSDTKLSVMQAGQLLTGRLNRVPLALPEDDTLALLKVDCGRTLRIQRLVADDTERSLFDIASLLNGDVQLNPVLNEGALVPLLIPNNPAFARSSAGYDVGLTVDADTPLTVITASRAKRHQQLALHIFYAGGGTALEVGGIHPGDARFADVLQRLRARYEAIGVEVAAIREYDVVGVLRDALSTLTVRQTRDATGHVAQQVSGLDQLFALSAGIDEAGISVFLVRSMGAVLGISGGIPGALGTHGNAASGVAVALDKIPLEHVDRAIFHELSHQQGLFHLVETDGLVLDPLADTPVCGLQHDSNGDGVLRSSECIDRGADNVMFWEGQGDALSAQQVDILRRSLSLY